jgi:hypothetical protein
MVARNLPVIGAEHRLDRELVHRVDFALFGCHVFASLLVQRMPVCMHGGGPPSRKAVNRVAGSKSG